MPTDAVLPTPPEPAPVRILVSTCLLGDPVRFDGGHKRNTYVVDTLGRWVEFAKACPEAEAGMGVPRETVRLEGDPLRPRVVGTRSGEDRTDRIEAWASRRLDRLAGLDLCGFVCKRNSPSCGLERVEVHGSGDLPGRTGTGVFTRRFRERFPEVPVEEEGRLEDPALRDAFLERVFARRRWLDAEGLGRTARGLVRFHEAHKLQLLAHGRTAYTDLGRLVAQAGNLPAGDTWRRYGDGFARALERPSTRGRTTDVLLHALGHFRRVLDDATRSDLRGLVEGYRAGQVPLARPRERFLEEARRCGVAYLARQSFLDLSPAERTLRDGA